MDGRIDADLERMIAELRREHQFAESILATVQVIVLVLDNEGRILRINPFMERLSGYTLAEVEGRDWFELFLPADSRESIRGVFQVALGGTRTCGSVISIRLKSGELREIAWWDEALRDEAGDVLGLVCVGHDLTALHEIQQKLVQVERLAAIGEAMTGLAHESRNALQRSQVCVELLADCLADRPEAREYLHGIQVAQDDLHHLFEEVRNYAAPVQLELAEVDARRLVAQAWEQLAPRRAGRDARLEHRGDGDSPRIVADGFALSQVFRNILENALDACHDPVRLSVEYRLPTIGPAAALDIAIRDNGPGISPEARERVFQSFFTTKTRGTGLGMAIARRLVEAHGGQIVINPEFHGGAEFLIRLPRGIS